jgi:hypothetical protein
MPDSVPACPREVKAGALLSWSIRARRCVAGCDRASDSLEESSLDERGFEGDTRDEGSMAIAAMEGVSWDMDRGYLKRFVTTALAMGRTVAPKVRTDVA